MTASNGRAAEADRGHGRPTRRRARSAELDGSRDTVPRWRADAGAQRRRGASTRLRGAAGDRRRSGTSPAGSPCAGLVGHRRGPQPAAQPVPHHGATHGRARRHTRHAAGRRRHRRSRCTTGRHGGIGARRSGSGRTPPGHGCSRSGRQPGPTLGPTGLQDGPPGARRHPVPEAVPLGPAPVVGLIGALHPLPPGGDVDAAAPASNVARRPSLENIATARRAIGRWRRADRTSVGRDAPRPARARADPEPRVRGRTRALRAA